MRLAITELILRERFRPNLIESEFDTSELRRYSYALSELTMADELKKIESALQSILGQDGEALTGYEREREDRDIKAGYQQIFGNNPKNTQVYDLIEYDDVLEGPDVNTPMLKLYYQLTKAEMLRTRKALQYELIAINNDAVFVGVVKDLLLQIEAYCIEASGWKDNTDVMGLLTNRLIQLYFEIVLIYQELLSEYDVEYKRDFSDFVYDMKGRMPSEEELKKYGTMVNQSVSSRTSPKSNNTEQNGQGSTSQKKDADLMLEKLDNYGFSQHPQITRVKDKKKLVEFMLIDALHFCWALDYIDFYSYIKTQKSGRYNIQSGYDKNMGEIIDVSPNVFKNIRLSLNDGNGRYVGNEVIDSMKSKYSKLLIEE